MPQCFHLSPLQASHVGGKKTWEEIRKEIQNIKMKDAIEKMQCVLMDNLQLHLGPAVTALPVSS